MEATKPVGSVVSMAQLRDSFAELRAEVPDPNAGLFGPGSLAWRLYGDTAVIALAGPGILLLQSSHPYIAHAVQEHSSYRSDPLGRAYRTLDALFSWIFGDLDTVIKVAREIRGRHNRVVGAIENDVGPYEKGHRYDAADSHAMLWVHATLWYVPVQVYELIYGPIDHAEKEKYYQQTKLFAKLFGIPKELIPPDWDSFCAYVDEMVRSDIFAVDYAATVVPKMMFTPAHPRLKAWARNFQIMTMGILPEPIQKAHGFVFGPAERREFDETIARIRRFVRVAPPQLRYFPAYRHAVLRMREKPPSAVTRLYLRTESEIIRQLTWIVNPALRRAALRGGQRTQGRPALFGLPKAGVLVRRASTGALGAAYNGITKFITTPPPPRKKSRKERPLAA